jgi:hypothetical protein
MLNYLLIALAFALLVTVYNYTIETYDIIDEIERLVKKRNRSETKKYLD